ncbi:unnamed protein product, partial [Phaeothamnion confervicola]
MLIVLDAVVDREMQQELTTLLAQVAFEDGTATAGWSARLVKHNLQAAPDPAVEMWRDRLAATLMANPLFALAARPKRIIGPMFSRYVPGHRYGPHVDEPVMDAVRVDLAFTLFLSDPDLYDGGELTLDTAAGTEIHKHPAGSLVLYPATTLHHVAEVTRGARV